MGHFILIILFFILNGALLIAPGIPLAQARIAPNSWYGFRTPKTLLDERIWYAINQISGRDLILVGTIILMSSLILFLLKERDSFKIAAIASVSVALLSVTGMVIHGFLVLHQM